MVKVIDIVGVIGRDTTLKGVIDSVSDDDTSYILRVNNSPGGGVFEGYAIYTFLKSISKPIETQIIGYCGSISTLIASAADKGKIRMRRTLTRFMIHNPSAGITGEVTQMEKAILDLNKIKKETIDIYAEQTGLSVAEISEMMDNVTEMDFDEALRLGFIDSEIQSEHINEVDLQFYNLNNSITTEKMEKNESLRAIEKAILSIKNVFKIKFNMLDGAAEDGSKITIDAETIDAVIDKKIIVAETGEPAPDGMIILEIEGKKYNVEVLAGVVVSYEEIVSEDMSEIKASLEKLLKENETLKTENETLKSSSIEAKNQMALELSKINKLVGEFKNQSPKKISNLLSEAETKTKTFPNMERKKHY